MSTNASASLAPADLGAPHFAERDGVRLAYRHIAPVGSQPTIVFLPGYRSDMLGGKATAVYAWAKVRGLGCLLLDYAGCGESGGVFEDGTLASWRDDALHLIDRVTTGRLIIVGSSMGGWIALLIALARAERVVGVTLIAAAPDFTEWSFSEEQVATLQRNGRIEEPSAYSDIPDVTTLAFWESGQSLRLLDGGGIAITAPVALLHGQQDDVVPWELALDIASALDGGAVTLHLIKDGDHRLSRDTDIAQLLSTLALMVAAAQEGRSHG